MSDDSSCIVLIFFYELFSTGKCDLVNVFVNFFGCHTDTTVRNLDDLVVETNLNGQVAQLSFEFTDRCQGFQFLCSIHSIRH